MTQSPPPSSSLPTEQRETSIRSWIKRLFGISPIRETIGELIGDDTNGEIAPQERTMISNILNVSDKRVSDVMVPRADIQAVALSTPYKALLSFVAEKPHSRYPVYSETLDRIEGVLHVKSLLSYIARRSGEGADGFALRPLLHEPLFCAPSARVFDLLVKMQQTRRQLAFIVDEYGGIDGMATIEDVVEEIVGEIHDEHDHEWQPVCYQSESGTIIADARLPLADFEKRFALSLTHEDDVDTLGGLVFAIAGRVPGRGELLRDPETATEFRIVDANARRILRLEIIPPNSAQTTKTPNSQSQS